MIFGKEQLKQMSWPTLVSTKAAVNLKVAGREFYVIKDKNNFSNIIVVEQLSCCQNISQPRDCNLNEIQ